jgi:hypothetical protein
MDADTCFCIRVDTAGAFALGSQVSDREATISPSSAGDAPPRACVSLA